MLHFVKTSLQVFIQGPTHPGLIRFLPQNCRVAALNPKDDNRTWEKINEDVGAKELPLPYSIDFTNMEKPKQLWDLCRKVSLGIGIPCVTGGVSAFAWAARKIDIHALSKSTPISIITLVGSTLLSVIGIVALRRFFQAHSFHNELSIINDERVKEFRGKVIKGNLENFLNEVSKLPPALQKIAPSLFTDNELDKIFENWALANKSDLKTGLRIDLQTFLAPIEEIGSFISDPKNFGDNKKHFDLCRQRYSNLRLNSPPPRTVNWPTSNSVMKTFLENFSLEKEVTPVPLIQLMCIHLFREGDSVAYLTLGKETFLNSLSIHDNDKPALESMLNNLLPPGSSKSEEQ